MKGRTPFEINDDENVYDKAVSQILNLRLIVGSTFVLYSVFVATLYCVSFFIYKPQGPFGYAHILSICLAEALTVDAVFRKNRAPSGWRRYLICASILAVVAGSVALEAPRRELLIIAAAEALACLGLYFLRI